MPKRSHSASSELRLPGNNDRACNSESVMASQNSEIGPRPVFASSALKNFTSNAALCAISSAPWMNSTNLSATSAKRGLSDRNSVVSPCTAKASGSLSRSGFR
ncbi:hypothetical protein D3C71_1759130 [compost metagenome]